jgi:serine/threonine protein kinase
VDPGTASCPESDELEAFLLGRCPPGRQAWLEEHVSRCRACCRVMPHLGAADPLVADLRRAGTGPVAPPPQLDKLIATLKDCRGTGLRGATGPGPGSAVPVSEGGGGPEPSYPFLAPPQGPDELGRLGPYRVLKLLGAGGMGLVFQAEDLQLGRLAALKVLRPHAARARAAEERLLCEARAAAQLRHDHIVTVYHVGKDRGVSFLAMELLEGASLAALLHGPRALPQGQAVRLGIQIAEGLAAAHARGFVHRDIKPDNIWVEPGRGGPGTPADRGRVKILDFGLARLLPDTGRPQVPESGMIAGTPAFMSPEQALGGLGDHRSDLFGLGCVLYRTVTGALPFEGPDVVATLMAVAVKDVTPPRRVNGRIAPALSDLIVRLLEKDPAARPPSARAVAEALRRIERGLGRADDGKTPRAPPADRPRPFRLRRGRPPGPVVGGVRPSVLPPRAWSFGGTVLRCLTDRGALIIEVGGPDVQVVVEWGGARIVDQTTQRTFVLGAGDGVVEVYEEDGVGPLRTARFTLNRGGRATVTVTLDAGPGASRPPRRIPENLSTS